MASSRDTSNGPDWRDVAGALDSLVSDLEAVPMIVITPSSRGGQPSLCLTATVSWGEESSQGALLSASVSVDMGVARAGGLSAALLFLLYDLDSKAGQVKGWEKLP